MSELLYKKHVISPSVESKWNLNRKSDLLLNRTVKLKLDRLLINLILKPIQAKSSCAHLEKNINQVQPLKCK